jgi:hypothetical protein
MQETPESKPDQLAEGSSSRLDAGRDIRAERDIAGDDIVHGDQAGGDIVHETTIVGFSPKLVTRLVIIVGVLVFITAACFFSGGIIMGAVTISALNRDVPVSSAAAGTMQGKLFKVAEQGPNQHFELTFSEEEINSYFNLFAAPQNGIDNGKIRLLEPGQLVVAGESQLAGDYPVAAQLELQDSVEQPLKLNASAVQVVNAGKSSFGWVALPNSALEPFADQLNNTFASQFHITGVQAVQDTQPEAAGDQRGWTVQGVTANP